MRKLVVILALCLFSAAAFAQETAPQISVEYEVLQPNVKQIVEENAILQDSLHLPLLNSLGQVSSFNYLGIYPLHWGGWSNWQLHKGLNVSLGASVFAEFGKHARHGAGFTQEMALQYAMPLTDKLSLSLGGYLTNITWQHDNHRDAGLSAVLGYRFNEKWEAYIYGQKSLVQTRFTPISVYDYEHIGDRIGAAVKYNFSPSVSIQLSVEEHRLPNNPYIPVYHQRNNIMDKHP